MADYKQTDNIDNSLAYDLRQKYAQIVGFHLEDIAIARKAKRYPDYFHALEDLYVIVEHKFKKASYIEDYKKLKEKAIGLINKYPSAYCGESTNAEEVGKIAQALKDMERFLYEKMDEANMFGSKRELEGLI